MNYELTPERVQEVGKIWGKTYLSRLSLEERLAGIPLEERLAGINPSDMMNYIK